KRVIVLGSCLSSAWPAVIEDRFSGCVAEHFLINNAAQLPADPPSPAATYDFQLIQIPLRQLLNEHTYFGLPYSDPTAFERLFDAVCGRLTDMLHDLMRWNQAHGVLTFVCNFLVPQQNPIGRLLPRYDLRNFVYFIEKLNEALGGELQQYENAYLFDFDQIVSTYGRRYLQDDAVWTISHGSALADTDFRTRYGQARTAREGLSLLPAGNPQAHPLRLHGAHGDGPHDPPGGHGQARARRPRRHAVARRCRGRGRSIEHVARGLAARSGRGAVVSEEARHSARHRLEKRRRSRSRHLAADLRQSDPARGFRRQENQLAAQGRQYRGDPPRDEPA